MVVVDAKVIFYFKARVLKGFLRNAWVQCDIVIRDLYFYVYEYNIYICSAMNCGGSLFFSREKLLR